MSNNKPNGREERVRTSGEKALTLVAAIIPWIIFVAIFVIFPALQVANTFTFGIVLSFAGSAALMEIMS